MEEQRIPEEAFEAAVEAEELEANAERKPETPAKVGFNMGDVVDFHGIPMKLTYINYTKRRFTFEPVSDSIRVLEPETNPIAGVVSLNTVKKK